MHRRQCITGTVLAGLTLALAGFDSAQAQQDKRLPNILFILADDLGYGDVACYNPESKIPTPNLDKPFFLYHSMQAVHLPSFAADRFKGKTKAGPHGDFMQPHGRSTTISQK